VVALNQSGYLKSYDYEDFKKDIEFGRSIDIFTLLKQIEWFSDEDKNTDGQYDKIFLREKFLNGLLKTLLKSKAISEENYDKVKTRIESDNSPESHYQYLSLIQLVLWKEYFDSQSNLTYIINLLKNELWLTNEKSEALLETQKKSPLKLEDIILEIDGFVSIPLYNSKYPLVEGIEIIRKLLPGVFPGFRLEKNICYSDTSYLNPESYFKVGSRFFNLYDSTEIEITTVCDLVIAFDSLKIESRLYSTDSIDVWRYLSANNTVKKINQLLIDLEKTDRLNIVNLTHRVGPSVYSRIRGEGLLEKYPELRILPNILPVVLNTDSQFDFLVKDDDNLTLIPKHSSYETNFDISLLQLYGDMVLVSSKRKKMIIEFLFEEKLIDTLGKQTTELKNQMKKELFSVDYDLLCLPYVKSHRIDISTSILFAENFTEKKSPVFGIFSYLNKMSEGKFLAKNIQQKQIEKRKILISFTINGNPHEFIADVSLRAPTGYFNICKEIEKIMHKENILTDKSLYFVTRRMNTKHLDLLFLMGEPTAKRWPAIFGYAVPRL
jgi:hypothetical protein